MSKYTSLLSNWAENNVLMKLFLKISPTLKNPEESEDCIGEQ